MLKLCVTQIVLHDDAIWWWEVITCSRQPTWLSEEQAPNIGSISSKILSVTKYCEYPPSTSRDEVVFLHKRTKYRGTMQSNMTFNQFKKRHCHDLWWGFLWSLENCQSSTQKYFCVSCEYLWGDILTQRTQSPGRWWCAWWNSHCPTKLRWPSSLPGC